MNAISIKSAFTIYKEKNDEKLSKDFRYSDSIETIELLFSHSKFISSVSHNFFLYNNNEIYLSSQRLHID